MSSVLTKSYPNYIYTCIGYHRDNSPDKSQWQISANKEIEVFENADTHGWLSSAVGWGLFVNETGNVAYLGISVDLETHLFIAKFIYGQSNNEWHGYPAEPTRGPGDIPNSVVLRAWKEKNILPAAKVRKITKGQPCKL